MQKIEQEQTKIKCICSYARVSTNSDEQNNSYIIQKQYWEDKLAALPNTKYIGTFADKGSGRKIIQRKEFCKMIELAKAGFIDEIYTKSLYRFARNSQETLRIIQELQSLGVAIIFEEDNINTLQMNSQVLMHLKALCGEEEISQMGKNVSFMARKRYAQGIPDRQAFYGYKVENDEYVINEEQAKVVQLIFALYLKGYGLVGIVKQLQRLQIKSPTGNDLWCNDTVKGILINVSYKGDLLLQKSFQINGKRYKNNGELPKYYVANDHEPIVDDEIFNTVQELIKQREKGPRKTSKPRYDFTGKIECACGGKFKHNVNNKIVNFEKGQWVCAKKDNYGAEIANCHSMPIPDSLLESITLDAYNEYIKIPYELNLPKNMQKEFETLGKLQFTVNKLYSDNLISIQQYNEEKTKISVRKKELAQKMQDYDKLSLYKKPSSRANEYSKTIVENHINKIILDGYKLKFIFKNGQEVIKEYKNEHRKYSKAY